MIRVVMSVTGGSMNEHHRQERGWKEERCGERQAEGQNAEVICFGENRSITLGPFGVSICHLSSTGLWGAVNPFGGFIVARFSIDEDYVAAWSYPQYDSEWAGRFGSANQNSGGSCATR